MKLNVLAVDLGASSGRGIVYTSDNGRLSHTEVHRFPNGAVEENGGLYWDADRIFAEICAALKKAASSFTLDGMGIDTWGVDFGIVGRQGRLIGKPRHYRDGINTDTRNSLKGKSYSFYEIAGIADNDFNTVYQLIALCGAGFDFRSADSILFMPQLFGYMLTGNKATEPTIASTSGFFRKDQGFDGGFLAEYGIPRDIFPPVKPTGSVLGNVKKEILRECGIGYDIPVILTAGHDTACAVAALDVEDESPLYISSGTWSLFGTLLDAPVIGRAAFERGYTNELAADGRIRFLKNIVGMWIIQECSRQWKEEGKTYTYPEIVKLAESAEDKGAYIDVNDAVFLAPGRMADRVRDYAFAKHSVKLASDGEIALCVYKSMAKAYKRAAEDLTAVTGKRFDKLYILGGGANNAFLNELTAAELGIPVIAGATEASSLGNALIQFKTIEKIL